MMSGYHDFRKERARGNIRKAKLVINHDSDGGNQTVFMENYYYFLLAR